MIEFEKEINEIINYFNEKTGRKISSNTRSNYLPISRLLREGQKAEEFKQVIDLKVSQWIENDKMKKYLRIETLFNKINFKKYLQESKIKDNYKAMIPGEETRIENKDDEFEKIQKEYSNIINKLKLLPYGDYLETNHWKHFKHEALIHFNFKCQVCGNTENLAIHHNNYNNRGRETFNDVTCLCTECHTKFHGEQEKESIE